VADTSIPRISFSGQDVRALTDELRKKHRIVLNELDQWVLLRHKDICQAAKDEQRFSSAVSRFLQIPNGLDGAEHDVFRALIEKYLTPERIEPFVPKFKEIARNLITELLYKDKAIDAVYDLGAVFAVRAQCAWLGWPSTLESRLLTWVKNNQIATRSRNLERTAAVANEFDDIIRIALEHKSTEQSITAQLSADKVFDRPLEQQEIISILRNWTSGDLGSMALCIGVLVAHMAKQKDQTTILRQMEAYSDKELELYIDEVLRLDNPFIANRRRTTCAVNIGGHDIPEGEQIVLSWISANRDEDVFGVEQFDPAGHAEENLLYGIGRHVCPGRVLATWQLRTVVRELLKQVSQIEMIATRPFIREEAPIGGYKEVPVRFVGRN